LEPGISGQPFDSELIFSDNTATHGYLAIVSGVPESGSRSGGLTFLRGDIAIDVTSGNADMVVSSVHSGGGRYVETTPYEYGIDLDTKALNGV